jgi:hypothetical protein
MIRVRPITAVEPTPYGLNVFYDWRDGVLRLRPVGNRLIGNWQQSNGSGLVELNFDRYGTFVHGRWNDGGNSQWHAAFLR